MIPSIPYDLITKITQISAERLMHRHDHYLLGITYERRAPIGGEQRFYAGMSVPEITELLSNLKEIITPSTAVRAEGADIKKILLSYIPQSERALVA